MQRYIDILIRLNKPEKANENLEKLHALLLGVGNDTEVMKLENEFPFLKEVEKTPQSIDASFLFFLDDHILNMVVMKLKEWTLEDGEYLFRAGDKGISMFLIMDGNMVVLEPGQEEDQPPVIMNFLSRGDIVGELAMFRNEARSADVIASKACTLFELERQDLMSIIDGSEKMTRLFNAQLEMRNRMTYISCNPLLAKLPLHARRRIAEKSVSSFTPAGENICERGKSIQDIRLLIKGSAKAIHEEKDDHCEIKSGSIMGELDVLNADCYSCDIVASTDVEWISIPLQLIQDIAESNMSAWEIINKHISR